MQTELYYCDANFKNYIFLHDLLLKNKITMHLLWLIIRLYYCVINYLHYNWDINSQEMIHKCWGTVHISPHLSSRGCLISLLLLSLSAFFFPFFLFVLLLFVSLFFPPPSSHLCLKIKPQGLQVYPTAQAPGACSPPWSSHLSPTVARSKIIILFFFA